MLSIRHLSMTIYNNYQAYHRALASGRKNIRFISVKPSVICSNPVTSDTGSGTIYAQSGDY